jgi:multidrug efflux pump subunit AcrA (membrane-fusion protein)
MRRPTRVRYLAVIFGAFVPLSSLTAEPGFTEPRIVIQLAAPELATVSAFYVDAGEKVTPNQAICELDTRSLRASLAAAQARRDARGQIDAARAKRALLAEQLARVSEAHGSGDARLDELKRARAELQIAEAELVSTQEQANIAALEYERIAAEITRRKIVSPLAATVLERRHEVGEAVTPQDDILAILAVLDPLVVRLNLTLDRLATIALGAKLPGNCAGNAVEALVARIAPVADAATATVAVELEIDNADNRLMSGIACTIEL